MVDSSNIALFDMDGTLCDYERSMRLAHRSLLSDQERNTIGKSLDFGRGGLFDKDLGLKGRSDLIKKQPGFWRDMKPIIAGLGIFDIARDMGFDCRIFTKGPYNTISAWSEKVEWCRTYLPPEVKITVTEDKQGEYGKVLVDDWPDFARAWLQWRPRGLVLMPSYSYNETMEEEFPNNVRRITYDADGIERARKLLLIAFNRENGAPLDIEGY